MIMSSNTQKKAYLTAKTVLTSITFNSLFLTTTNHPTIEALMGRFTIPFANIQVQWFHELMGSNKLPNALAKMSRSETISWILQNGGPYMNNRSTDTQILAEACQTYASAVQNLLRSHPSPTSLVLHSDYKASQSCVSLFKLLQGIRVQHVHVQLQELFIILCCHVMYTDATYTKFIQLAQLDQKNILHAEKFIVLLLGCSPDEIGQCIHMLSQRYKGTRIPTSDFRQLNVTLADFGMSGLLNPYEPVQFHIIHSELIEYVCLAYK